MSLPEEPKDYFSKYELGKSYPAGELIQTVIIIS